MDWVYTYMQVRTYLSLQKVDELLAKINDKELSKKVVDQIANETINKHNLSGSLAKLERMAS